MISKKEINENIIYLPETGQFQWRISQSAKIKAGMTAGGIDSSTGYYRIKFRGRSYRAHRLAFLYMTGEIPYFIDHINGNRSDNRWINLRQCSRSQNGMNRAIGSNSTSNVVGVGMDRNSGKWRAYIYVNKKRINLGRFVEFDDAVEARRTAELCYHKGFSASVCRAENDNLKENLEAA